MVVFLVGIKGFQWATTLGELGLFAAGGFGLVWRARVIRFVLQYEIYDAA